MSRRSPQSATFIHHNLNYSFIHLLTIYTDLSVDNIRLQTYRQCHYTLVKVRATRFWAQIFELCRDGRGTFQTTLASDWWSEWRALNRGHWYTQGLWLWMWQLIWFIRISWLLIKQFVPFKFCLLLSILTSKYQDFMLEHKYRSKAKFLGTFHCGQAKYRDWKGKKNI